MGSGLLGEWPTRCDDVGRRGEDGLRCFQFHEEDTVLIDDSDFETKTLGRVPLYIALLVAVGIILMVVFCFYPRQVSTIAASNIRICNATGEELKALKVGGQAYGDLSSGTISGYQKWKSAYRYASVSAQLGGREFTANVDDFVGELPLGSGDFTYAIVLHAESGNRRLEAILSDDNSCRLRS